MNEAKKTKFYSPLYTTHITFGFVLYLEFVFADREQLLQNHVQYYINKIKFYRIKANLLNNLISLIIIHDYIISFSIRATRRHFT